MSNSATAITAWIAFGISVGTFMWKFMETYIRWPRLGVTLRQTVSVTLNIKVTPSVGEQPEQQTGDPSLPGPESGHQDRFDIIVVNSGAEATTVSNVGIRSVDRSRIIDVERERESGTTIDGPDLPARVEAHGSLTWIIQPNLTSRFPRGTKLIGYAHRYRRFHKHPKWRQNTIRLYETPLEYVKN
jgi:hypothetical protein